MADAARSADEVRASKRFSKDASRRARDSRMSWFMGVCDYPVSPGKQESIDVYHALMGLYPNLRTVRLAQNNLGNVG